MDEPEPLSTCQSKQTILAHTVACSGGSAPRGPRAVSPSPRLLACSREDGAPEAARRGAGDSRDQARSVDGQSKHAPRRGTCYFSIFSCVLTPCCNNVVTCPFCEVNVFCGPHAGNLVGEFLS